MSSRSLIHRPRRASILLRPAAFLKLLYCCHTAATEIGGFGISAANDPLVIEAFALVPQRASIATVEFDDAAVADHADRYADQGVEPARSLRVWVHTHPGESAAPSSTDEATFARSFGGCDWAAMLIQSRGEENYCRLRFNAGPGGDVVVPVAFDWASLPAWLERNAGQMDELVRGWAGELDRCVVEEPAAWRMHALAAADAFDPDGTGTSVDARLADDVGFDCELGVDRDLDFAAREAEVGELEPELEDDAERWLAEYEEEVLRGER